LSSSVDMSFTKAFFTSSKTLFSCRPLYSLVPWWLNHRGLTASFLTSIYIFHPLKFHGKFFGTDVLLFRFQFLLVFFFEFFCGHEFHQGLLHVFKDAFFLPSFVQERVQQNPLKLSCRVKDNSEGSTFLLWRYMPS